MSNSTKAQDLFFDNYLDASCRLNELEEFRQYVGNYLGEEERYLRDEAHVDLEIGFLPLFAETFPPILHSSLIISTVILLEMEVKGYAEALRRVRNLNLGYNDLSGSLIERFRKYVTVIGGIQVPVKKFHWADIVAVFEIRNALVHNGGMLPAFPKANVIRSFESRHGTPICTQDRMKITAETSKTALDLASSFIDAIYEAVDATPERREMRQASME